MKKLKYLVFIFGLMLFMIPNVNALDYTYPRRFAGKNAGDVFSISPSSSISGDYYYGIDKSATSDYIVLTYCSVGPYFSSWVSNGGLNNDAIQIDTGLYCSAGGQGGTIKYSYYFVKYWTYSDSSDEAYIEGSSSSLKNNATYTSKYQLYGLEGASSFDVSYAILAYLQSQEEGTDYSSALSKIQQNTSKYNEEIKIVQDKLNETNTSINDMKDALTNSDITESENEANSFFDGFDVTDNGGISSIVTSPLVAIEKMVSGTCSPLTATYKGKTITLPCGNSFWADMPDVQNFLNIILGGFLCYGILAKLYLLIDRLKNPEDDRVEVMKL